MKKVRCLGVGLKSTTVAKLRVWDNSTQPAGTAEQRGVFESLSSSDHSNYLQLFGTYVRLGFTI